MEIDGGLHRSPDVMLRDAEPEHYLQNRGYRILRFSDREVLSDPDAAAARVRDAVGTPPPSRSA